MRTTRPRCAAYCDLPNFAASCILSLSCLLCAMRGGTAFRPPPANNARRARAAAATASLRRSPSSFATASNGTRHHPPQCGRRRMAALPSPTRRGSSAADPPSDDRAPGEDRSPRSRLRRITGFSLTALRATLRTATGFSHTALRAALRAATGISLSGIASDIVRRALDVLSPSMRYFLQPLLIAYYAPLLAVRYRLVGPSRAYVEEGRAGHERIVEGWRRAVGAAERANAGGYWPVHLNGELDFRLRHFVVGVSFRRHSSPFFVRFAVNKMTGPSRRPCPRTWPTTSSSIWPTASRCRWRPPPQRKHSLRVEY